MVRFAFLKWFFILKYSWSSLKFTSLEISSLLCLNLLVHLCCSKLVSLSVCRNLQELIVKPVFVSNSIVLLKASHKPRIILKNHVLKNSTLIVVQDAFLWHFRNDGEEHAWFRPDMSREKPVRVVAPSRLLRDSLGCLTVHVHSMAAWWGEGPSWRRHVWLWGGMVGCRIKLVWRVNWVLFWCSWWRLMSLRRWNWSW